MIALLAALAWGTPPSDPWWYTGLPLAGVTLASSSGGLPPGDLEPLLRARQGDPADPQALRADLVTLYRVGEFQAVEADLQPWFLEDAEGNFTDAVMLTYWVQLAPSVAAVQVQTRARRDRRPLLEAAGIDVGEVFFAERDASAVQARVQAALAARGYPNATVEIDVQPIDDEEVEVWIRVSEGAPQIANTVQFLTTGLPSGDRTQRKLRAWAKSAGLVEGQPYASEALDRTRFTLRSRLARPLTPLRTFGGWMESRVSPPVVVREAEGDHITFTVEGGRRLDLNVTGMGWRQEAQVRSALGMDERLRITRGFVEDAPQKIETHLQRRGFLDANAQVELMENDALPWATLRVRVERGTAHLLRRAANRYRFEGLERIPAVELRTVLDQASPEVLKRGFVTPGEVQIAAEGAVAYLNYHGYSQATVVLARTESTPYLPLTPLRIPLRPEHWAAPYLPRAVRLHFKVSEGPRTMLSRVEVRGVIPEVKTDDLAWPTVGGPYSPQVLAALGRQITERHRALGYVYADTRPLTEADGPAQTAVIFQVQPGEQVLLRSLTVRGARQTRTEVVRAELDEHLVIGAALAPQAIADARSALYDLDVFSSVNSALVGEAGEGDLLLTVQEKPRYTEELGAGLATDLGVRAFTRASRRNLWGRAHRLDAYGQASLQWRTLTEPEWRSALSYTAPRFPMRGQQVVGDILVREIKVERTWKMLRSGLGITLDTQAGPHTTLQLAGRAEGRQLESVDIGAILSGEPWDALLTGDGTLPTAWRLQDSISARALFDRRDDPVQPTRGGVIAAVGELSPGWISDSTPFLKTEARINAWLPTGRLTVRLSGDARRAWPLGDGVIALEDRYRIGGTGTLRGYRRDAVGPRNWAAPFELNWPDALDPVITAAERDVEGRWVPTGGDTLAAASAELLVPFPVLGLAEWNGYAAALFADAGNAWLLGKGAEATSESGRTNEIFNPLLRYSAGAGLRMETPLGPFQLDLALNPATVFGKSEVKSLLRDEWDEPIWRAHLSLGTLR